MWLPYIFTCIPLRPSDVDECSANTKCKNGATCVNTIGAYQCLCSRGYQGKHCDQGLNFVITNGPVIFRSPGGILGVSHSLQGEHNKDQPSLKDYIYKVYWGKGSLEFYRALRWDKVNFILTHQMWTNARTVHVKMVEVAWTLKGVIDATAWKDLQANTANKVC